MDKIDRIKELVEELSKASDAYYVHDNPIMSDKHYDELYDELEELEVTTGFVLSTSVTQKVQGKVLDGFNKITHSKPMLSAAKTKDVNEIEKFVSNNNFYCSYKLDGLTLVCSWENGELKQAVTRGTGIVGEDVTEQAKMISNLPLKIPYTEYLELRGECVISWDNFKQFEEDYKKDLTKLREMKIKRANPADIAKLEKELKKNQKLSASLGVTANRIADELNYTKSDAYLAGLIRKL